MSYLRHLQQSRWVQTWSDKYGGSHYSIRLGNSGRNGCAVRHVSKQEEKDITTWFGQHGIRRDATETNMWWFMEQFSHQSEVGNGTDSMVSGGYEFRISKDTYNALFSCE
jgi:hypothetical protein